MAALSPGMEFGKNLFGKHISHEGEFRSSRFRFSGLGPGVVAGQGRAPGRRRRSPRGRAAGRWAGRGGAAGAGQTDGPWTPTEGMRGARPGDKQGPLRIVELVAERR